MPYTFQSRATADLIMLNASAEHVLKLLDKALHVPGIITAEQIPHSIAVLEQAVRDDETRRQTLTAAMQDMRSDDPEAQIQAAQDVERLGAVTLRQRLAPFLEMLRSSAQDNKPVTWTAS